MLHLTWQALQASAYLTSPVWNGLPDVPASYTLPYKSYRHSLTDMPRRLYLTWHASHTISYLTQPVGYSLNDKPCRLQLTWHALQAISCLARPVGYSLNEKPYRLYLTWHAPQAISYLTCPIGYSWGFDLTSTWMIVTVTGQSWCQNQSKHKCLQSHCSLSNDRILA